MKSVSNTRKVCGFADSYGSALGFLKCTVGRPQRQHTQRVSSRHREFWMPAAISTAIEPSPTDGGIELDAWITRFNRGIDIPAEPSVNSGNSLNFYHELR